MKRAKTRVRRDMKCGAVGLLAFLVALQVARGQQFNPSLQDGLVPFPEGKTERFCFQDLFGPSETLNYGDIFGA